MNIYIYIVGFYVCMFAYRCVHTYVSTHTYPSGFKGLQGAGALDLGTKVGGLALRVHEP